MSDSKMRIIQADHPNDVKHCCNKMLAEWLRVDLDASWEKLFAAIKLPVVPGEQAITDQGIYLFEKMVGSYVSFITCLLAP